MDIIKISEEQLMDMFKIINFGGSQEISPEMINRLKRKGYIITKLKRCPFCGTDPIIESSYGSFTVVRNTDRSLWPPSVAAGNSMFSCFLV